MVDSQLLFHTLTDSRLTENVRAGTGLWELCALGFSYPRKSPGILKLCSVRQKSVLTDTLSDKVDR